MGTYSIFVVRLVVSVILAFLISRIFFQSASMPKILGLAAIMLILAYLFEFTRRKERNGQNGT